MGQHEQLFVQVGASWGASCARRVVSRLMMQWHGLSVMLLLVHRLLLARAAHEVRAPFTPVEMLLRLLRLMGCPMVSPSVCHFGVVGSESTWWALRWTRASLSPTAQVCNRLCARLVPIASQRPLLWLQRTPAHPPLCTVSHCLWAPLTAPWH